MPFGIFKRKKKEDKEKIKQGIKANFYVTPGTFQYDINNPKPYERKKEKNKLKKNENISKNKNKKVNKKQNNKKIKTFRDLE